MSLKVIVTLSKEVVSVAEAEALYTIVKAFLADKPDIDHQARVTERLEE